MYSVGAGCVRNNFKRYISRRYLYCAYRSSSRSRGSLPCLLYFHLYQRVAGWVLVGCVGVCCSVQERLRFRERGGLDNMRNLNTVVLDPCLMWFPNTTGDRAGRAHRGHLSNSDLVGVTSIRRAAVFILRRLFLSSLYSSPQHHLLLLPLHLCYSPCVGC